MASQKVTFPGASGAMLSGRLDLPEGPTRAYALFAHCFTCGKDLLALRHIGDTLAGLGIAVLRFDFTGLGHSEGEFASSNFSGNVADLLSAADWLRRERQAPQLMIGHSLGGAAVLMAAKQVRETTAVATIGAPSDPAHVLHLLQEALPRIREQGTATVRLGERSFPVQRQFLEDIAAQKLEATLQTLRKSLLILHAPRDEVVGIDNASRIFAAAKHPKSFVSLADADHLLTRPGDARYAAGVIAAWAAAYLPAPEAEPESSEAGAVLVKEQGAGPFTQQIRAGRHRLAADEPRRLGGEDRGPTPYDLLLAALGACTAMTLRLYANRKGWTVPTISVRLRHRRVHAQDCADCASETSRLEEIERDIHFDGPVDPEQRQRLLEIAERCPVHRTLQGAPAISTRLHTSES